MVTAAVTSTREAERALVSSYAPAAVRSAFAALLTLDATLGGVVRTGRDPMVTQLRLTWWHDALAAIDRDVPPAEPVLQAVAADVIPLGVTGATLAAMVDGWEALLDPGVLDVGRLRDHAVGRGERLFVVAGKMLGAQGGDSLAEAGQGWALADLAQHVRDSADREAARQLAEPLLARAAAKRWSPSARSLGALVHLARSDLAGGAPGSPGRTWRLLRHRLTGQ